LFVAAIANLKAASTLALDDNFAVQRAQFYLANVSASNINFFGDQGTQAPGIPAFCILRRTRTDGCERSSLRVPSCYCSN